MLNIVLILGYITHLLKQTETPIGAALGNVHQQFVSSIDTLKNTVNKTVLLATSNRSKRKTPPFLIQLEEATKPIKPSKFDEENYFTGVLLEGKFPSLFANRIAPFEWQKTTQQTPAKIAVFSDGNMAENQLDKGTPLELGYDKWTNNLYTNKVFLQNTIHFLMGEIQRLNLRSKEIRLAFLDTTLVNEKARDSTKSFCASIGLYGDGRLITFLQAKKISSITSLISFFLETILFRYIYNIKQLLMKFIVSSNQLLKQLQVLGGVINSSNTLPILDNFLRAKSRSPYHYSF